MLLQHPGYQCFELTAIIALEFLGIYERASLVNVGNHVGYVSHLFHSLIGLVTLHLEAMSIPERTYLYSFLNNISVGMYNKSN